VGDIMVGMFGKLAKHGMAKFAALMSAVVVGVAANLVIDYIRPNDPKPAAFRDVAPAASPAAMAAPAPVPPMQPIAPAAVAPIPTVKMLPDPPVTVALPSPAKPVPTLHLPEPSRTVDLPMPAMLAPPLRPAALPLETSPTAVAPMSLIPPEATREVPVPPKPGKPSELPVEATAAPILAPGGMNPPVPGAPVSLLPVPIAPPVEAADQLPPKPVKPGPGSGGLY